MPADRVWDAVRFAVCRETESGLCLAYVCERNHLPAEHGELQYQVADQRWLKPHEDRRIQRMAECFLESRFERARRTGSAQSGNGKAS